MTVEQLYQEFLDTNDQLSCAIKLYERGCALFNACSADMDRQTLPVSVECYLEDISKAGIISTEALIEIKNPIGDSLKAILKGLMNAITWVIEQIVHLFRLIFDIYFRAQRKLVAQQAFILQFVDEKMREEFANSTMLTIRYNDFHSFNEQVKKLVLILQSSTRVVEFSHANKLFANCEVELGCKIENTLQLVNIVDLTTLEATGVLKALGWDYDKMYTTVGELLTTTHDSTTLKQLNKYVLDKSKELKSKIEKNISNNASSAVVTELQEQMSSQNQIYEFTKSGLVIVATRIAWMDKYFSELIDLMRAIQKNKK